MPGWDELTEADLAFIKETEEKRKLVNQPLTLPEGLGTSTVGEALNEMNWALWFMAQLTCDHTACAVSDGTGLPCDCGKMVLDDTPEFRRIRRVLQLGVRLREELAAPTSRWIR